MEWCRTACLSVEMDIARALGAASCRGAGSWCRNKVSQRRGLRRTGVGVGESTRSPSSTGTVRRCRGDVREERASEGTDEWSRTLVALSLLLDTA